MIVDMGTATTETTGPLKWTGEVVPWSLKQRIMFWFVCCLFLVPALPWCLLALLLLAWDMVKLRWHIGGKRGR